MMKCSSPEREPSESIETPKAAATEQELIARGRYLSLIGGCNDCHSPKIMTPMGPAPDTTRLLSGHPQDEKLGNPVQTQEWVLFNPGATAYVGPWGISYAANLSPDETGIGNWTFQQFENAIRKGKFKGLENSRLLLPPMPWQMYQNMSDEDLKKGIVYIFEIDTSREESGTTTSSSDRLNIASQIRNYRLEPKAKRYLKGAVFFLQRI